MIEDLIAALTAFEGVIVVEGKKDVAALAAAGITARELEGSADAWIERLAREGTEQILVLTDRDRTGNKLRRQIRLACEHVGIMTDETLRTRFFSVTQLRVVEGFDTWLDRHR